MKKITSLKTTEIHIRTIFIYLQISLMPNLMKNNKIVTFVSTFNW